MVFPSFSHRFRINIKALKIGDISEIKVLQKITKIDLFTSHIFLDENDFLKDLTDFWYDMNSMGKCWRYFRNEIQILNGL